jgi:cytochrome c peroxidase
MARPTSEVMACGFKRRANELARRSLIGGVSVVLIACGYDTDVSRLPAPPISRAVTTDIGDKMDAELSPRLLRRFAALPEIPNRPDSNLVKLGRMLFFEPLISRSGKISCNSCHPLDRFGTTGTRFSVGVNGTLGRRNAPSVYNTSGHLGLFWDGRAANLTDQAMGPLFNPNEMGMEPGALERTLNAIPEYRELFEQAFPHDVHPVRAPNVASAIAEFERGLNTPARWDRYLKGDLNALSAQEKEGAKLFANLGCMVCHTGAYVGGTMYEKLGVFVPWPNQQDHGRREVTHDAADDMVFKVPSLRNVAKTAPYFHDGSAASLDTAIRMMARHQLGVDLSEAEAQLIASWLSSLTGDISGQYTALPKLPQAARP